MKCDLGHALGGISVEMNARAMAQRLGARKQRERDIDSASGLEDARLGKHHAARQIINRDFGSCEIQCGALACKSSVGRSAVDLHAAHPPPLALRKYLDLVVAARATRDQ